MLLMTMDYLVIIGTIFGLAASVKPHIKGVCVFPGYVQSSPKEPWVMPHPEQDRFQAHFSGSSMIGTSRTLTGSVSFERSCEERLDNEKFVVSHRQANKPIKYLCMQFIKRSDSVIQLKTSNYSVYMRNYICYDSHLVLDHKPLVSIRQYFHHKIPCPFQGGYNFRVFDFQGEPICEQILLPLRIESDCEKGEGMTLKFRENACVQRDWGINPAFEKLQCLARWEDGPNTFIVLRKVDKFRVWCARMTKDTTGQRSIYIFFDFICDPGDEITMTDNFIRLEMEKQIFSSTCEDESPHCTANEALCDSHFGPHCPSKCGRCSYADDLNTCDFLDTMRGDWLQLSSSGNRRINIKLSEMKIQGTGSYKCIKLQAQEFLQREVLLQIFNNGCHPRYTCVDFEKVAPSVIRYRLGHSVEWPLFHIDHKKQHICGNHRFVGIQHEYKPHMKTSSIPMLSLINKKKLRFVKCNFPKNFPDVLAFVDAQWCGGCLSYNRYFSAHTFSVTYANCSNYATKVEYQCLASMKLKEYRGIITKTTGLSKQYLCWIFDGQNRIFNVFGSDCDYVTAENLHLGFEEPSSAWVIRQNVSFCGTDGPVNTEPGGVLPSPTQNAPTPVHPPGVVISVEAPAASSRESSSKAVFSTPSRAVLVMVAGFYTLKQNAML